MTVRQMTNAWIEAKIAITNIAVKYDMDDDDFELYYHMIMEGLTKSVTDWSRERWMHTSCED